MLYEDQVNRLNASRDPLTGGRRRSDRWVAYLLVVLIGLGGLATTYSIQRQRDADEAAELAAKERQELLDEVRAQNRAVLCIGTNTVTAELAFAEYLLSIEPRSPGEAKQQEELRLARDRLAEAAAGGDIKPCPMPGPK